MPRCASASVVESAKQVREELKSQGPQPREGIFGDIRLNAEYRDLLSNDLGAIGGLLFDVGAGRYSPPPLSDDDAALAAWKDDLAKIKEDANAEKTRLAAQQEDISHTQAQGWLRDMGRALGFGVWVASNDRNREYDGGRLSDGCLGALPESLEKSSAAEAISLIDVLWFNGEGTVAAAFEVEHTTSIYSGIVRMLDLALSEGTQVARGMFLVAPDEREEDVRKQLQRPAFSRVADLQVRYLPYSELAANRESIARFGRGMHPIEVLARVLN